MSPELFRILSGFSSEVADEIGFISQFVLSDFGTSTELFLRALIRLVFLKIFCVKYVLNLIRRLVLVSYFFRKLD